MSAAPMDTISPAVMKNNAAPSFETRRPLMMTGTSLECVYAFGGLRRTASDGERTYLPYL